MEIKEKVFTAMNKAGKPLRTGEVAELAGVDKKDAEKAIKAAEYRRQGIFTCRCLWQVKKCFFHYVKIIEFFFHIFPQKSDAGYYKRSRSEQICAVLSIFRKKFMPITRTGYIRCILMNGISIIRQKTSFLAIVIPFCSWLTAMTILWEESWASSITNTMPFTMKKTDAFLLWNVIMILR